MPGEINELKEKLKKTDAKGIAVLLGISLILGIIYGIIIHNIPLALIAMTVAVFATFFLLSSFFEEEKPVELLPGEKMIIRTMDRGYLVLPDKKGGFLKSKKERDLSIYLTDKRVFARKSSGEFVFEQPLVAIKGVVTEKKFFTGYLRITYHEQGTDKQALLFIGDIRLWTKRLGQLGIKSADEYDEQPAIKNESYKQDAAKLKHKVEKKQQDEK
jgi:hypothetical protein